MSTALLLKAVTNRLETVSLGGVRWSRLRAPIPKPGTGIQYRYRVKWEDKYTVKPLYTVHLAGRDPVTGVKVCQGIGGGIKHKYHTVDWFRYPNSDGTPLVERVIQIIDDGNRSAHVALVAQGDRLRYVIASENMKAGDIISSHGDIPKVPVRPCEGDSHPLGALPVGTLIHAVQKYDGYHAMLVHAAGCSAKILKKLPNNRILIELPSGQRYNLPETHICTVGRVGNIGHKDEVIGSAWRYRWLGFRPRSGWWQRKDGRFGRRIHPPKPIQEHTAKAPVDYVPLTLHLDEERILPFPYPKFKKY